MTTDPFTEAARAEALRAWVKESDRMDSIGTLGAHMAEWARDRLTTQEATDAEVKAATLELYVRSHHSTGRQTPFESLDHEDKVSWVEDGRAVLSAARAARRDEEHVHAWRWKQNTTSRGLLMPPIEVCPCGAARDARRDEEKR